MARGRRMEQGSIDERARLRHIGVLLWLLLVAASIVLARAAGPRGPALPYVLAGSLATAGAVALVLYAQLASTPPSLRTLRTFAVLLPTLFVVSIEAILLVVEADEVLTEVGEHIFATAVLALSTVPFSLWVFRRFEDLHAQVAEHAERLETLHAASLAVTADPATETLPSTIVRGARVVTDADRAVLMIGEAVGSARALTSDPPAPLPDREELDLISADDVRMVGDPPHVLLARTRGPGRTPHTLLVQRSSERPFTAEESLLLDMYAMAAAAAIENARRLEEAQRLATVEERERIARDLHDDLGQLLGFLTAKIQAVREHLATGRSERAADELMGLEAASRSLSAQVREAILGLRTSLGQDRPLAAALETYTTEFGIQAALRTTFETTPGAGERLPAPARYQVLRIAQEALSNVRRHAGADVVRVRLSEADGNLHLRIEDDGRGFDPDAASGGFGLKTMRERAQTLGGTLQVRSAPGGGTEVRAIIPLEKER